MKMATKLWDIGQCGWGLGENGLNFYAVIKCATKELQLEIQLIQNLEVNPPNYI